MPGSRKKEVVLDRVVIPYDEARDQDVISGRGDKAIRHIGNGNYRRWINERKAAYDRSENNGGKRSMCWDVIHLIRQQTPPGRFLRLKGDGKKVDYYWEELTEKETVLKTSQAFRDSKGLPGNENSHNRGSGAKITEPAKKSVRPTATKVSPKSPATTRQEAKLGSPKPAATRTVTRTSRAAKVISPDEKQSAAPCSNKKSSSRTKSSRSSKTTKKRSPPSSDDEEENEGGDARETTATSKESPPKKPRQSSEEGDDDDDDDGDTTSTTDSTASIKHHQHQQNPEQQQQQPQHQLDPFANYHLSETLSDIEIVCEDENGTLGISFPGHKAILISSSSVLKAALEADPSCTSVAFHYAAPVVKEVLAYIYTEDFTHMDQTVVEEYLWDFLSISKSYKFRSLHDRVFQMASSMMNMGNLMETLVTADQQAIKDVCLGFIQAHPSQVLTDPTFARLSTKNPCLWQEVVDAALSGAAGSGNHENQIDDEETSRTRHKLYTHGDKDGGSIFGGNITV